MPETVNEEKTTTKNDQWRERITKARAQRIVCEAVL
jgi:hypothetical protein